MIAGLASLVAALAVPALMFRLVLAFLGGAE